MMVISELKKMYGADLHSKRILLLNAGGQSQRIPSASVPGKLFCPLPLQSSEPTNTQPRPEENEAHDGTQGPALMQQLDFKLANSKPFLARMKPGFLHGCSDTIDVYDLGGATETWNFESAGFTGVSHPATPLMATKHGVYILDEISGEEKSHIAELRPCNQVLQKPTVEKMREKGAIYTRTAADGVTEEVVFTDSYFFFDHDVADKLCDLYEREKPFNCEIDAYGDFLQALGDNATPDYTEDVRNVSRVEPRLQEMRRKIYNLLRGIPLNIVVLHASNFYHLGSMPELIYHFNMNETLAKEMSFDKSVLTSVVSLTSNIRMKRPRHRKSIFGCSVHNHLVEDTYLDTTSVLEYCNFAMPCHIDHSCIVSNCEYVHTDIECITITSKTFLHTIPIKEDMCSKIMYVTVFFSTSDDIKKTASDDTVVSLPYFATTLSALEKSWKCSELKFTDPHQMSLWNAKLFPSHDDMSASFKCAINMITALQGGHTLDVSNDTLYSMADITKLKDVQQMLHYRTKLYEIITRSQ